MIRSHGLGRKVLCITPGGGERGGGGGSLDLKPAWMCVSKSEGNGTLFGLK